MLIHVVYGNGESSAMNALAPVSTLHHRLLRAAQSRPAQSHDVPLYAVDLVDPQSRQPVQLLGGEALRFLREAAAERVEAGHPIRPETPPVDSSKGKTARGPLGPRGRAARAIGAKTLPNARGTGTAHGLGATTRGKQKQKHGRESAANATAVVGGKTSKDRGGDDGKRGAERATVTTSASAMAAAAATASATADPASPAALEAAVASTRREDVKDVLAREVATKVAADGYAEWDAWTKAAQAHDEAVAARAAACAGAPGSSGGAPSGSGAASSGSKGKSGKQRGGGGSSGADELAGARPPAPPVIEWPPTRLQPSSSVSRGGGADGGADGADSGSRKGASSGSGSGGGSGKSRSSSSSKRAKSPSTARGKDPSPRSEAASTARGPADAGGPDTVRGSIAPLASARGASLTARRISRGLKKDLERPSTEALVNDRAPYLLCQAILASDVPAEGPIAEAIAADPNAIRVTVPETRAGAEASAAQGGKGSKGSKGSGKGGKGGKSGGKDAGAGDDGSAEVIYLPLYHLPEDFVLPGGGGVLAEAGGKKDRKKKK